MAQIASSVLMVRPSHFGFNQETAANNVFQSHLKEQSARQIQLKAQEEFDAFIKILEKKKIEVMVFQDPATGMNPDAVFPNNWFATFPDGRIAIFPLFAPNRRTEKSDALIQMVSRNHLVSDVEDWSEYEAEGFFLEGTGSMIFDHERKLIYACLSPRTHKAVLERFASAHGYKAIMFHARDEKEVDIYHTNVMMHLGESYAVICLESIPDETERIAVSQLLISTGHEIIPISLAQVHAFAGNMLQVKNREGIPYTILSKQAYRSLTREQKSILQIHTRLLPISIETIETIGGGSVRCMMAEIFLSATTAGEE